MEFARNLKTLWQRRRLLALGVVIAAAAAVFSVFRVGFLPPSLESRSNVFATASTQILVDTHDSAFADIANDITPLATRAGVFARFLQSPAALTLIAAKTKIPIYQLDVRGPVDSNLPRQDQEPTAERRSSEIIGEDRVYRMRLENNPIIPLISVFAQAPTQEEAIRLANSAPRALRTYVKRIQAQQNTPLIRQVDIRRLGLARGGVVNKGADLQIAALVFLAVLGGWCILLIPAQTIARGWRGRPSIRIRARTGIPEDGGPSSTRAPDRAASGWAELQAQAQSFAGRRAVDAWPHTRRPLPWLIAALLTMIFLVPFDSVRLNISLPVSSDLDRFVVATIVFVWILSAVLRRPESVARLRPRGWAIGMIAFFYTAVASIVLNVERITNLSEWPVAQKRIAVLLALVAVFAVVTLTLRVAELRPFSILIVCLALLTSVGTIVEKKTGYNIFYDTASTVFSPIATVDPAPTDVNPDPGSTPRPTITGPTRHALSVTTILGMALPFAIVLAAVASEWRRRLLWGLASCVIIAGALITQRKSGAVVPAMALLALFVLRPRQLLRLAPFGIVALALGLAVAPGIFSTVRQLGHSNDQASTEGRTSDYPAVVPDLLSHPILGRGFGTLDSSRVDTYRIFDNEYLGEIFQVGALGLIAYLAMVITPLFVARGMLRTDDPIRGPPALAAAAACLAFGVASALYDILTFPQAPYLFLFMAAMCTCAASLEVPVRPFRSRLSRKAQAVPA